MKLKLTKKRSKMRLRDFRNSLFLLAIWLLLGSCDLIQIKDEIESERAPIARAKEKLLYPEDLIGIIPGGISKDDSTERVERYIEDWARKQLLIDEAYNNINIDEAEIERKVMDYRYSLLGYEYEQYYVNQNLNTEISDEEIEDYYNNNVDNFVLKQNIIRGKYVEVPLEAPNTRRIRTLIRSKKEEDFEELKSYCLSFASTYQLYDSVWMVFEDLVKSSPLAEVPNKVQFLRARKYVENSDADHLYYLLIEEYRISDNISPLEFVRDQIRNIIMNKRKVELAKKLEDEVYQRAIEANEFEIYRN